MIPVTLPIFNDGNHNPSMSIHWFSQMYRGLPLIFCRKIGQEFQRADFVRTWGILQTEEGCHSGTTNISLFGNWAEWRQPKRPNKTMRSSWSPRLHTTPNFGAKTVVFNGHDEIHEISFKNLHVPTYIYLFFKWRRFLQFPNFFWAPNYHPTLEVFAAMDRIAGEPIRDATK